MESDRGAVRWAREPEVQILAALARLEEEDDIARMEIGQRVEEKVVTGLLLLCVELGFFVRVWKEAGHVCEQMTMAEIVSFK